MLKLLILIVLPSVMMAQPAFYGQKPDEVKLSMKKILKKQITFKTHLVKSGELRLESGKWLKDSDIYAIDTLTGENQDPMEDNYEKRDLEGNEVVHSFTYLGVKIFDLEGYLTIYFHWNGKWNGCEFHIYSAQKKDFQTFKDSLTKLNGKGKSSAGDNSLTSKWSRKDYLALLQLKEGDLLLLYGEPSKK